MWQAMLAGAGLGTAKHFAVDKPNYNADARLAAATTRYSPWTGLQSQLPERPNLLGSVMQGASMGGGMGQSIGNYQAQQEMRPTYKSYWEGMAKRANGPDPMASPTFGGGGSTPATFGASSSYVPMMP